MNPVENFIYEKEGKQREGIGFLFIFIKVGLHI